MNESKLNSTVHNNDVDLPGFELVRESPKFKGRNGGGVCSTSAGNYGIRHDLNSDEMKCLFVQIS